MNEIDKRVDQVRRRLQWQRIWNSVSIGLLLAGCMACVLSLAQWLVPSDAVQAAMMVVLAVGPLAGWVYAAIRRCRMRDAAVVIDRACQLKDRAVTALRFLDDPPQRTAWQDLQLEDTRQHLADVQPAVVAPLHAPRTLIGAVLLSAVAVATGLTGSTTEEAAADVTTSDVVMAQADRIEDGLTELQEPESDQPDPEFEELLQELSRQLQDLRRPGVIPRDALATLSEMEAALQEKQRQLQSPETSLQLAAAGRALSLSGDMKSAGQALIQQKLAEAAEELSDLEMPILDPQTKAAITEELARLQQQTTTRAAERLKEAAAQISEGLEREDREQFREGAQGLAEEAGRQARRDRLTDMLQRQLRRLAESKSECEAEARSLAGGNKQGSRNFGLSRGENPSPSATARLQTGEQLRLSGQDTQQGEAETETVKVPEASQEAMRRYAAQSATYEQLSESVLDAEPIPPGQRRTIRRYFEMIRPTADEVDEVEP